MTRLDGREIVERVFGGSFAAADDIFELVDAVDSGQRPALYVACGAQASRTGV